MNKIKNSYMAKKFVLIIVGVILFLSIGLLLLKGLNGEGGWICIDGEWVKHGNPSVNHPNKDCGLVDDLNFEEKMIIKVFFGNIVNDPNVMDCDAVYPVEREVVKTPAVARAALEELFKGPTKDEINQSFFTSINEGVTIQKLGIADGVAIVDLSKKLEEAVGGSCRTSAIRAQITQTLKQFSTVKDVVISIDGRTEDILQP